MKFHNLSNAAAVFGAEVRYAQSYPLARLAEVTQIQNTYTLGYRDKSNHGNPEASSLRVNPTEKQRHVTCLMSSQSSEEVGGCLWVAV